jgi:adenine phosphoribosyltransferase
MISQPVVGPVESLLKESIVSIPDFPIAGINFKDITPLLADPALFPLAIDELYKLMSSWEVDAVVAIESRGFIVGAPLADRLRAGLIPVRKPGKLPGGKDCFSYTCEYSTGTLEVRENAIREGGRYLVVDDLLATGGTARATYDYITAKGGAVAGFGFLVELTALNGRALLERPVQSLLQY